jgi:hypothetical protein
MGTKVSDQYVIPLCHEHHMECHENGNESLYWALQGIDVMGWATETFNKYFEERRGHD